jgi:pyrophosphatase PpaX
MSDEQLGASIGSFQSSMMEWGVSDAAAAVGEVEAIARRTLPEVELYPDAMEVLEDLHRQGKQLALITTSARADVLHLMDKHNLSRLFDTVVAGDDVTHHKPHPEPLEKALSELGGTKDIAVMIGDSSKDIGAAHNAGIDSILFYPPEHAKFYDFETLKSLKPTYIVHDFKDILTIVRS